MPAVDGRPPGQGRGGRGAAARGLRRRKTGKRDRSAAGLSSIWETVHRGARDMGVKRSLKTLLSLNQKDGFDCPSCAWPDPDDERKTAEFCENGAKAVASEATRSAHHARVLRAALDRRSAASRAISGSTSRAASRTRWCGGAGADHYEPISWDDAFALIGARAERARLAERGVVLHLGPRQQRGGVPLRPVRAPVRHQQPARLLEHVPRVERPRADRDDRHRQGDREDRGLRARRQHLHHRPEPRHQPPAHADRAAEGGAATAARSSASTRCPRPG